MLKDSIPGLRAARLQKHRGSYRAICFDLDGVLLDTMPFHAQAWQDALKQFGGRVSRRLIYAWEGESGTVTAKTLLRGTRIGPSRQAEQELLRIKEHRFRQLGRRVRMARSHQQLLRHLSRQRVPIALVTGTSQSEVRRVIPDRILKLFGIVVTGDGVRHGKPHPEPYRTAMQRLRVVPRQTIVVENAPYGIQSARRAGAGFVIAVPSSLPRRFLQQAHLICSSDRLASFLPFLTGVKPYGFSQKLAGVMSP